MRPYQQTFNTALTSYKLLNSQWSKLCTRYLPVSMSDSIWRYSRQGSGMDLPQGWKLHIAATILSAVRVFETVAPLLTERDVRFKAPMTLSELEELNRGTSYGYSQVGKFLTIYPQSTEAAVQLALEIHERTRGIPCPQIPFDFRYRRDSCVFYRYGGFQSLEMKDSNGELINVIRDRHGNLIPDQRDSVFLPEWEPNPFPAARENRSRPRVTPLQTTFRAFQAFTQRGKGGVYHALDCSVSPARLCVIKQGRRHGEVSWDRRDGRSRVKHEKHVLNSLTSAGVPVPMVYSSFNATNNYFLVVEFIAGENLGEWLARRKRRLPVAAALKRGAEVARMVARIHAAGWVWRDCKPHNMIVTKGGRLRPLDFEGACKINSPDPLPWCTPGYSPSQPKTQSYRESQLPEDLYALGATIHLLLAGRLPDEAEPIPLEDMRKNVPKQIIRLVSRLLHPKPQTRPNAHTVARHIDDVLKSISQF